MKITIEQYGQKAKIYLPDESSLDTVIPAIVAGLIAAGWNYEVILNYLQHYCKENGTNK